MAQPPSARGIWLFVLLAAAWCAAGIWTRFENLSVLLISLGAIGTVGKTVGKSSSLRIEDISDHEAEPPLLQAGKGPV